MNKLTLPTLALFLFIATSPTWGQESVSLIAGTVIDEHGQGLPGVTVALLDQASGQPLDAETGKRFGEAIRNPDGRIDDKKLHTWTLAITDDAGRFEFGQVAPGTYRVVAQSWHGWDRELKREVDLSGVTEVWKTRAQVVHLRGVAENVVAPSTEAESLTLSPIGTGVLHLEEKNSNGGYVAVLSTQPLAADPVLFFMGWDANFLSHGLATHHAPPSDPMIYRGLPPGEVHVAMFFYDNRPGSAAGSTTIKPDEIATLNPHAVAGWSDGRKDPPPHLLALMNTLIENDWKAEAVLGELPEEAKNGGLLGNGILEAWGPLDRPVELPDGSRVSAGDLMAASAYRKIQKLKH